MGSDRTLERRRFGLANARDMGRDGASEAPGTVVAVRERGAARDLGDGKEERHVGDEDHTREGEHDLEPEAGAGPWGALDALDGFAHEMPSTPPT